MSGYAPGALVRLLPEFCDRAEEAAERFVVVEDRGDRLLLELVCDWRLRPQEVVAKHMVALL